MRNIPRVTFQGEKKKKKGILDKLLLVNFPLRQKLLNCLLRPYIACIRSLCYLVYLYFSEVLNNKNNKMFN